MLPADLIPWRAPGAFPFGAARLRVNWANPLTKGMAGLWLLGRGGAPINLVTGEVATAFNTPLHGAGVAGPAWTNNGSTHGWEVKNGSILSGRSEWTIAAAVAIPTSATTSGSGRAIYCERAASGNDITKLDFGPNNTTNMAVVWRNTAGNLINPSPTGDSRNSRQSVFSASLSWAPNTTTIRNYIGGGLSRTDTVGASSVTQSNASKRCTIGYDFAATSSTNLVGDVALVAVFEPEWAAERHALFARDPWALLIEQAPIVIGATAAGATAYTLTAAQGSFTLTGQAATLKRGLSLTAAAGSFTHSGQAATLKRAIPLTASVGTFTLSGQAATLRVGRVVTAASGAFTETGQAASLLAARILPAGVGSIVLTGQDAGLLATGSYRLSASPGALTLTGQSAGLYRARLHTAAVGTFALSGQAAGFRFTRVLAASVGALTLSGTATLRVTRLTGQPATGRSGGMAAAQRHVTGSATRRSVGTPAIGR